MTAMNLRLKYLMRENNMTQREFLTLDLERLILREGVNGLIKDLAKPILVTDDDLKDHDELLKDLKKAFDLIPDGARGVGQIRFISSKTGRITTEQLKNKGDLAKIIKEAEELKIKLL